MNTELLPGKGRILCAVSGGTDSVFLLCRLRELGYSVAAAHFHHGLRGASADRDEAFVRRLCEERDIPFLSERGDTAAFAKEHGLGIEEAARTLRYAFLERAADTLDAAVIATAHTADDNAETILMHLTRGTGLAGLCGIPPVRGRIVRPMLDTTRVQAEAYLTARCLPHVEDETNAEDESMRNRIRHTVIPALRAENPALAEAVSRAASLLREDETYLSGLAEAFLQEHAEGNTLPVKALRALPRPIALRAIRGMAGSHLSAQHAEAIYAIAGRGGYADVPGMRVGASEGKLVFGAHEGAVLPDRTLFPGQRVFLPEAGLTVSCEAMARFPEDVHKPFNTFFFKCENICGNMTITARRPGDEYRPKGRGCTKTVRRLLMETGVPSWERDTIPVLRDDAGILGVYGVGPAERAAACAGDENIYRVDFIRRSTEDTEEEHA